MKKYKYYARLGSDTQQVHTVGTVQAHSEDQATDLVYEELETRHGSIPVKKLMITEVES